jgi:hypothetical protein
MKHNLSNNIKSKMKKTIRKRAGTVSNRGKMNRSKKSAKNDNPCKYNLKDIK